MRGSYDTRNEAELHVARRTEAGERAKYTLETISDGARLSKASRRRTSGEDAQPRQQAALPTNVQQEDAMSRHNIPASVPGVTVVVGWDNPLSTFFAQVTRIVDADDERDPVLCWIGASQHGVLSVEDLAERVAHYADIPADIVERLRADRAACADRGPSQLQHRLLAVGSRS